nr:MAG TPA: Protein of unknown function (DUF4064) [Caudoviricetes sp.]
MVDLIIAWIAAVLALLPCVVGIWILHSFSIAYQWLGISLIVFSGILVILAIIGIILVIKENRRK